MDYIYDVSKILGGGKYTKFKFTNSRDNPGALVFGSLALDLDGDGEPCMMAIELGKQTQSWVFDTHTTAPRPVTNAFNMGGLKRTYSELFGPIEEIPYNAECKQRVMELPTSLVNASNNIKIQYLFNQMDKNNNGVIDGRDFDQAAQNWSQQHGGNEENKRREVHTKWEHLRNFMDCDLNGAVDFQEFSNGLIRHATQAMKHYPTLGYVVPQQMWNDYATRLNNELVSIINKCDSEYFIKHS